MLINLFGAYMSHIYIHLLWSAVVIFMYNHIVARVIFILTIITHLLFPLNLLPSGDIHPNPGPYVNNFRICHLNIRSLKAENRFEEFVAYLNTNHFDIICLSETHLDDTVPDSDFTLPNFTLYRKDRNRMGGGVGIFIHDHIPHTRRYDLELDSMEIIWMELSIHNKKHLISCCYRPPGQSAAQVDMFLTDFQYTIDAATSNIHISSLSILGDFNDRCTSWDSDHTTSEFGNRFRDLIKNSNLHQLIQDPTRDPYLLDLIITDSPNYFIRCGVLSSISDLDHDIIYGDFKFTYTKSTTFKRHIRYYDQGDYISMKH